MKENWPKRWEKLVENGKIEKKKQKIEKLKESGVRK